MEMLSDDGGCKREREGGRKQGEYRDRGGDHQVSPNKTRRTRKRGGSFSLSIIFSLSFFYFKLYPDAASQCLEYECFNKPDRITFYG